METQTRWQKYLFSHSLHAVLFGRSDSSSGLLFGGKATLIRERGERTVHVRMSFMVKVLNCVDSLV